MATHSSILVWRIPWTKEPGGLQATGHKQTSLKYIVRVDIILRLVLM